VPPIDELTRIEPVYLGRLEKQGIFTTGILIEVSETPTRRQTLADHVGASILEVLTWRDEALMLNLAAFGPNEHILLAQAGFRGLESILEVDQATFTARVGGRPPISRRLADRTDADRLGSRRDARDAGRASDRP
jgi:hypothetical protein